MQTVSAVIAHPNGQIAGHLASSLQAHVRRVEITNADNLRSEIAKNRAEFAVIDLEAFSLDDVREICQEFSETRVVCVHRISDEEMWTAAVEAGAVDCCLPSDMRSILAALRAPRKTRRRLAVAA